MTSPLEFSTSSITAISTAISQKVDLIVLLTDDSENSEKLEKFLNSIPSTNLINNSKCICLKLKSGETDAENIQKTFPNIKVPSVSIISTQPLGSPAGLTLCIELNTTSDSFDGLTIGGFMGMLVQNINGPHKPIKPEDIDKADKAKEVNAKLEQIRRDKAKKIESESVEKEKKRIEDGKKLAEIKRLREESDWADEAAKRAADRKQDKEAKIEMARVVKEEKEARIEKNRLLREESEKRREEAGKNKVVEQDVGRKVLIGITLPNGSQPRKQFSAESDTLEDLINWSQVLAEDAPLSSYHLVSKGDWSADISPSKSQKHMKLKDFYKNEATARAQYKLTFFGAGNKQVLSSSSSKKSGKSEKKEEDVVAPNGIFDIAFGFVNSVILMVVGLLKSIFGGIFGDFTGEYFGSSSRAHSQQKSGQKSEQKSETKSETRSENKSENKSENSSSPKTPSDQTENIRKRRTARLHDLKRDGDDNTTYNGNSSAQL